MFVVCSCQTPVRLVPNHKTATFPGLASLHEWKLSADDAAQAQENSLLTRRSVLLGTAAAAAIGAAGAGVHHLYKDKQPGADSVAWLRDNAVPLATTEPGSGFADLEPLRKVIGDARIVSLGE